jgi:hypothetical protein
VHEIELTLDGRFIRTDITAAHPAIIRCPVKAPARRHSLVCGADYHTRNGGTNLGVFV